MSGRRRSGCIRGERGRAVRRSLAARDGARCFYCSTPFPDPTSATLDHFVPWRLWPTNLIANLVLACFGCNQAKADRLPLTFMWLLLNTVQTPTLERAA